MRELKICTFDEIETEEVRWLWKPYIAFGKVTVIQGDPGNGKTTLALAIASLVSQKLPMPTGDAPPFIGNIIYQSGEDGAKDTIKPRLLACGADCSRIAFVDTEDAGMDVKMFEEAIVGTNAKLAVIDPLQSILTEKQDISSVKYMRPLLRDLGNIAAKTGAAIVIIGHMNKTEKFKGIYRGLGSIDITAAVRSVLLVGKQKDNKDIRFMAQIKNNLAPIGKAVSFTLGNTNGVEFLGECCGRVIELPTKFTIFAEMWASIRIRLLLSNAIILFARSKSPTTGIGRLRAVNGTIAEKNPKIRKKWLLLH